MSIAHLRRLFDAPEIIVVDLADASLSALRRAIVLEHPTVAEFPDADRSDLLRRAAVVLHHAARLSRALGAYRRAVDRVLELDPNVDSPF
jgi:hypothetical protein